MLDTSPTQSQALLLLLHVAAAMLELYPYTHSCCSQQSTPFCSRMCEYRCLLWPHLAGHCEAEELIILPPYKR